MWRRAYLFLVLVRLYFALSPSYLHPDENFQGPEVIAVPSHICKVHACLGIALGACENAATLAFPSCLFHQITAHLLIHCFYAGQIFSYPVRLTWEFTSDDPIRSVFPLWPIYGLPMLLLRWLWIGNGNDGEIPPVAVFWTLRVLMFVLSFVLEDWAIHELVQSPRHRKIAVILVASSYVTWTYQTHTFSNSIETLAVAWSLILIQRITENKPFLLALLRFTWTPLSTPITQSPGPTYAHIPRSLLSTISNTTFKQAILLHMAYTHGTNTSSSISHFSSVQQPSLFFFRPHLSLRLYSAISGVLVLSIFQHQEARFLLPTIPLILSSVQLPKNQTHLRIWAGLWIAFNVIFGLLMGVYHQGGIIPTQVFLSKQPDATQAIWWKTYSPPIWLLNGKNEVLRTHDIMGMKGPSMLREVGALATCHKPSTNATAYLEEKEGTYLIAPLSATFLDIYVPKTVGHLHFQEVWRHTQHLNLDDLDFGDDGLWPTLKRVIGRRGLAAWRVTKDCKT
ncbi:GPI mannosyltransferase [Lachnellula subtilissima]|uniref:Mannosyltransferase n=1 Tax=Lachnellula subtilissima TaxID=602034 RepID=A0A8H8RBH3_9HELO|nr:GPI mannosyltransferase [Lachnellula subtilissima]